MNNNSNNDISVVNYPYDHYTRSIIDYYNLAVPEYNAQRVQEYVGQNYAHDKGLNFKGKLVKSWTWEDIEKAKLAEKFLNEDIRDKFNDHIKPKEFFNRILRELAELNAIRLHLEFNGDTLTFISPLQGAFVFPDRKKEHYYFINPNAEIYQYNFAEPSDVQIYAEDGRFVKKFKSIKKRKKKESGSFILEVAELKTNSDYTPRLPYQSVLDSVVANLDIDEFEKTFIKNATQAKNIYVLQDGNAASCVNDPFMEKTGAAKLDDDLNKSGYYNNNKSIVIGTDSEANNPLNVYSVPFAGMQDFTPKKEFSKEQILIAHDLSSILVGIPSSGGLATNEQIGAYNIFMKDTGADILGTVNSIMDTIFSYVDTSYNTKFEAQAAQYSSTEELEAKEKEADIKAKQLANIKELVSLGDLELFNDYVVNKLKMKEFDKGRFEALKSASDQLFSDIMSNKPDDK